MITERDRQILTMRQLGYTYQQIADSLDVSSKERVKDLYDKAVAELIRREVGAEKAKA